MNFMVVLLSGYSHCSTCYSKCIYIFFISCTKVGAEIARLEQEFEECHQRELSQLKTQPTSDLQVDNQDQTVENMESGIERLQVAEEVDEREQPSKQSGKKSRAQKRKVYLINSLLKICNE